MKNKTFKKIVNAIDNSVFDTLKSIPDDIRVFVKIRTKRFVRDNFEIDVTLEMEDELYESYNKLQGK